MNPVIQKFNVWKLEMKLVNKKYRYLKRIDGNIDTALFLGLGKSSCRWFNPLYNLLSALAFSVLSHCMLTIRKSLFDEWCMALFIPEETLLQEHAFSYLWMLSLKFLMSVYTLE